MNLISYARLTTDSSFHMEFKHSLVTALFIAGGKSLNTICLETRSGIGGGMHFLWTSLLLSHVSLGVNAYLILSSTRYKATVNEPGYNAVTCLEPVQL